MLMTCLSLTALGLLFIGVAADLLYGPEDSEPRQWPPWRGTAAAPVPDSSTAQVVESSERGSEP